MTSRTIKTVVFMGSSRNIKASWGGDARLGDRVLNWVKKSLSVRTGTLGSELLTHDFYVVDPLEVFCEGGALAGFTGAEMRAPVHFMKSEDVPQVTKDLAAIISAADCFLIVSPEYNHTIPPALSSLMGHFGGSNYSCKPSGIITYSPSPFAGMRAAMAIQIMCHELGCLPVSKLCGIPNVADVLELDGTPKDPENRMLKQLPELLTQLEWMALAMANQREKTGKF